VLLTDAPNEHDAAFICDYLKAEGIEATTEGTMTNRMQRHWGSAVDIKILVSQNDLTKAQEAMARLSDHKMTHKEIAHLENEIESKKIYHLKYAFTIAIIGFFFLPFISGLVALYHLIKASKLEFGHGEKWSTGKLMTTLLFIVLGFVIAGMFLSYKLGTPPYNLESFKNP